MSIKDLPPLPEKKFFKTVIKVEVLSEGEPAGDMRLGDIEEAITWGGCSGSIEVEVQKEISAKQMVVECKKHETDPTFFDLDEEGERTDFWHIND